MYRVKQDSPAMYTHLAPFYDWSGALDFSNHLVTWSLDWRKKLPPHPAPQGQSHWLDLGTGTGTIALMLAHAGYHVVGVDRSAAMVEIAQTKAQESEALKEAPGSVQWVVGDMGHLDTILSPVIPQGPPYFHTISAFYDTMNHLLSLQDLHTVLRQAFEWLHPQGCICFDVNTLENYQHFWQGKDTDEGPNVRLVFQSTFSEAEGRAHATITAHQHTEEGLVTLDDEVIQQYYPPQVLKEALQAVGFTTVEVRPFSPIDLLPDEAPIKWMVTAIKP